ncbi:MAG TPA: VOC family protein [Pyrinomonadaceae bacterium]
MADQHHEMPAHGTFCWTELSTKDAEAAKKFYTELLGWEIKTSDGAGMVYNEIVVGGKHVGGIYQAGPECGGEMPTRWSSYVAVDDVDASAKRVEELGGKVSVPPMDIPNTGRFCVITDPTGANISLITLKGASS